MDNNNPVITSKTNIQLSKTQKEVFNKILPSIKKSSNVNFLIHGVPGSGKTEIYVKLAQEAISIGKNVMVLIPEIILTTQMKDRFIKYFGSDIAMWHSKMTTREKKQTIKKIVVGPGVHIHQRSNGVVVMGEQDSLPISHDQRLSHRPEQFPNRQLSLEHGQRIVNLATIFIPQFKDLVIDKVDIGWRPLPRDGKPVVGFLNQYEYLATMHSGISLAPIIAELAREELMFGVSSKLLSDFRPQRFSIS